VLAGTTGKVTGTVTDGKTGEPLVGVNVVIDGTRLGGATNARGQYVILNVPPGTCRVRATLVGYLGHLTDNVRVFIDQTSTVEIVLDEETIGLGEVVTTAERQVVRKDVSTSVASFDAADVRALPVTDIAQVAQLQAGVENGLVIRGGGADQSLFLLNGVTQRDPRNNQPITQVALNAVQEVSVERGGFTAEYGQLQSGIVNVVTKEGGEAGYTVAATVRGRPPTRKYMGTSPFDPSSMWLRPYLDPAVAFDGTANGAWDPYTQRQYPQFEGWNQVSQRLMQDTDPTNDLSPAGAQRLFEWQHRKQENTDAWDYNIDVGVGGPVPFAQDLGNLRFFLSYRNFRDLLLVPLTREDYYEDGWLLRLTSDITPTMKLDLYGTAGKSYNVAVNGTDQASSTDYLRSPYEITEDVNLQRFTGDARIFLDSYYSLADVKNWSGAAQLTHVLSATSFYDVRVEYIDRKYDAHPTYLRDTSRVYEIWPGYFTSEAPFGWSPQPETGVDGMLMGGHTSTTRDQSNISSLTIKSNVTSQLDAHNQMRAGIELLFNNLDLNYGVVNLVFPESNQEIRWHHNPYRLAAYLQDKLEYLGFVANLGLRLDYSSGNVQWIDVDPFDPSYYSAQYDPNAVYPTKKADPQLILSPRLGISHPITEYSKLYFNYGHFQQLPTYEQLLRLSRGSGDEVRAIGDPSLEMERTIAYELGYDHSLFDEYLLQVAGFYRDVSNHLGYTTYVNADGSVQYDKATNDEYQDIMGFEATFRKTTGRWVTGFANYTYQVTTGGRFNKGRIYEDPSEQSRYDRNTTNLYQYRPLPTPYARVYLNFFTPGDYGTLLGDWSLNFLFDWRSGGNVTWNPSNKPYVSQNVARVDWSNLNVRLTKGFTFGSAGVLVFMDVANVFNNKQLNLSSFYDFNDEQDYYRSLHLPESPDYNNIPGDDKAGDYRAHGVAFQPIEAVGNVNDLPTPVSGVIYYDGVTRMYMEHTGGAWAQVDQARMDQILDDKAYIDMPNLSSFNFLNPRNFYFGITLTYGF
jgi:outer membrane receptor protein involved in Fe transport